MKLWSTSPGKGPDTQIERFTVGDDPVTDLRLLPHDCRATAAHAAMLHAAGILTADEFQDIETGLEEILEQHRRGEFSIRQSDEDVHTAIENQLTMLCGKAGRKIHTGRSRNDQVLTAVRLYEKEAVEEIISQVGVYLEALNSLAAGAGDCALPGYTHTRRAMPTTVATWAGGFSGLAADDLVLLTSVLHVIDQCPLGTGAGFGIPVLDLDRRIPAKRLGFSRVLENPMGAQLGRGKLEAAVVSACSQVLLGLNRLASDLILFSTPEFGFVRLETRLTTGSSIMPHKRNPDVLEVIRAAYHLVNGEEMKLKGLVANLMSGYHRDLQEAKKPVFQALDTTRDCLAVMPHVLGGISFDQQRCRNALSDDLHATHRVYERVARGMPFRDAYREVARDYRKDDEGQDSLG